MILKKGHSNSLKLLGFSLKHETNDLKNSSDAQSLMQEAIELKKILSSILMVS